MRDRLRTSPACDTRDSSDGGEGQNTKQALFTESCSSCCGSRTQSAETVHVRINMVPTQTVAQSGFKANGKNTAFTVCDGKPQRLHTKQNPEILQQLL